MAELLCPVSLATAARPRGVYESENVSEQLRYKVFQQLERRLPRSILDASAIRQLVQARRLVQCSVGSGKVAKRKRCVVCTQGDVLAVSVHHPRPVGGTRQDYRKRGATLVAMHICQVKEKKGREGKKSCMAFFLCCCCRQLCFREWHCS